MQLSYNETSLPGTTGAERLQLARQCGVALEIANDGSTTADRYQNIGLPITAVQAYLMHEFHPLHLEPAHRQQATTHLHQTLELAAQVAAPRVITACGFGQHLADRPFERALDFFNAIAPAAKSWGIRVMIEPLSPRRAAALTDPAQIAALIEALNQPEVFALVLDTGHLSDSGFDLDTFFRHWSHPIKELQLKGAASAPPSADWPLASWIDSLPSPPAVACVEHRQPIGQEDCLALTAALQRALAV